MMDQVPSSEYGAGTFNGEVEKQVPPALDQRRRTQSDRKAFLAICDETDVHIASSGRERSQVEKAIPLLVVLLVFHVLHASTSEK